MKRLFLFGAIALAICGMAFQNSAQAEIHYIAAEQHGDKDDCCDSCGGGPYAQMEVAFLKFYRSLSVPGATTFDYNASPRFTLGYTSPGGLGIRFRWWDYNHTEGAAHVETYNIDVELYERVDITSNASVEVSGGFRFNEYEDNLTAVDDFHGFGGLFAIQANRAIRRGELFARYRLGMLFDEAAIGGVTVFDVPHTQHELALGWQGRRELNNGNILTVDLAYEWQNWENYEFASNDVGFSGAVFGVGLNY